MDRTRKWPLAIVSVTILGLVAHTALRIYNQATPAEQERFLATAWWLTKISVIVAVCFVAMFVFVLFLAAGNSTPINPLMRRKVHDATKE